MQQGIFKPECRFFANPEPEEIMGWLRRMRLRAYAPGSHYKVADVLGMKSRGGVLFFGGVNVECLDLRQTVHSEECAIAFMVTALGKKASIHEAWVVGAPEYLTGPAKDHMADLPGLPCGNCRQQIHGLAEHGGIDVHCVSLNGKDMIRSIDFLLPDAFQFEDFDPEAAAERDAARGHLAPDDPGEIMNRVIRKGLLSGTEIFEWLNSLESVDYASRISQSVILLLDNGYYVAGVKVENAAYTGLNAIQAALGIATVNFGPARVREIYALSKSRRSGMDQSDLIYPLSLPSIQGLNEFIENPTVPVTLFAPSGDCVVMDYGAAAECLSNFAVPAYHIRNGTLQAA